MVPSRELALQTAGIAKEMSKYLKIQVMTTTGGTKLQDDIVRLYDPVHLIVCTPGVCTCYLCPPPTSTFLSLPLGAHMRPFLFAASNDTLYRCSW
jgi:hypothetical protein